MKFSEFTNQALSASESLFSFAEFAKISESYFDKHKSDSAFFSSYKEKWFELEIVNAVALDDWESEGRPRDWSEKWDTKYKKDAANIIQELLNVVNTVD